MTIAIIVHGGASSVAPDQEDAYRTGILAALEAGWTELQQGCDACAAVEAAIRVMEDDETFNAGRGSALNADGEVEMDAALMEGGALRYGALTCGRALRHPISVARQILEVGPLLLAGDGLHRFAEGRGAELCDPEELITEKQRQHWQETQQQLQQQEQPGSKTKDTVGCVALDANGLVAVGSSTGGEDHAPPGRVGDTAQIGCGVYADNERGACAVTGTGEAIMQIVLAKGAVDLLGCGLHPDEVARRMIDLLGVRVDGEGGCIIIDQMGRVGWAHNSSEMPCAYRTAAMQEPFVAIRRP